MPLVTFLAYFTDDRVAQMHNVFESVLADEERRVADEGVSNQSGQVFRAGREDLRFYGVKYVLNFRRQGL